MSVDERAIEALLEESRVFPPPPEFAARRTWPTEAVYEQAAGRPGGVLGGAGARRAALVRKWDRGAGVERRRSPSGSSAGSSTSPTTAWTATSARRRRTRPRSSGKASPATSACSPTGSCTARSASFANVLKSLGVEEGRPRRHLHADGPRAGDRDAGLRADRRAAHASSSAASAPRRCATASTTARRRSLITADGGYRRGGVVPLKAAADEALRRLPTDRERGRARPLGRAHDRSRCRRAATTGGTS